MLLFLLAPERDASRTQCSVNRIEGPEMLRVFQSCRGLIMNLVNQTSHHSRGPTNVFAVQVCVITRRLSDKTNVHTTQHMRAIPTVPLSRDTMYHSLTPNKKKQTHNARPSSRRPSGGRFAVPKKKKEKERENKKSMHQLQIVFLFLDKHKHTPFWRGPLSHPVTAR